MPYLQNDETSVYYDIQGDQGGFPLIFVHGLGLSHVNWQEEVQFFTEKGYRTLTFDMRGHGDTYLKNLTDQNRLGDHKQAKVSIIEQVTKDLFLLLKKENIHEGIFTGYSLGALVVQKFAATYSDLVRGMILNGAFPKVSNMYMLSKLAGGLGLSYLCLKTPLQYGVALTNAINKAQIKAFRAEAKKVNRKVVIRFLKEALVFDCRDTLPKLKMPIMITYGGKEKFMMTYRHDYLMLGDNVEVVCFPHVNHAVITKKAQQYNAVCLDFVQRIVQHKNNYFLNPKMINPTPNPISSSLE